MLVKNKKDLISLILDLPTNYIKAKYPEHGLLEDLSISRRALRLDWDTPISDIYGFKKINKKVNSIIKPIDDKKEKLKIREFIANIACNGLPANSFFTLNDFGFDFHKNKFELFLDGKPYHGDLFCLGTDESYDYYVISPDFKGVRKVFHDVGEIEDIDFYDIDIFAKTIMKFSIIQGSLNKGKLNNDDLLIIYKNSINKNLKEVMGSLISNDEKGAL